MEREHQKSGGAIALLGVNRTKCMDFIVEKSTVCGVSGCWIWRGAVSPYGYGTLSLSSFGLSARKAHRVAYAAFNGPVGAGLVVRHTCDVRLCVNPEHLALGTQADNVKDMVSRGRCSKGSIPVPIDLKVLRMLIDLGYTHKRIARMFKVERNTITRRLRVLRKGVA